MNAKENNQIYPLGIPNHNEDIMTKKNKNKQLKWGSLLGIRPVIL